jgi:AcrR family transcriptional regulator
MPLENQFDTEDNADLLTPGRRSPVQFRGYRTVHRVLDAASSLLEQMPLDEVTTTRIAAAAGLSIGGLYRFFPDKQTILDAIAVRHVEQFRASLVGTVLKIIAIRLANRRKPDLADIFGAIIDAYILYLDDHPDFRAISFGRHISAATRERQMSSDLGVTALLKRFMLDQVGAADTTELDLKLRLVSEAGERLITYAFEQPTHEERDRVIAEMKKMLAGYLFVSGP